MTILLKKLCEDKIEAKVTSKVLPVERSNIIWGAILILALRLTSFNRKGLKVCRWTKGRRRVDAEHNLYILEMKENWTTSRDIFCNA